MACAKCSFYRPKGSSQAQIVEAKANLLHLKQDIPLTDEEAQAIDDGLQALERLCTKLTDVPTPAGPTPRDLASQTTFVPLASVERRVQANGVPPCQRCGTASRLPPTALSTNPDTANAPNFVYSHRATRDTAAERQVSECLAHADGRAKSGPSRGGA